VVDPVFDPVRAAAFYGWQRLVHALDRHEVVAIDAVCAGFTDREILDRGVLTDASYDDFVAQRNTDLDEMDEFAFTAQYASRFRMHVGLNPLAIVQAVSQAKPDVIGITSFSTQDHPSTVHLARLLRQHFPSAPIVVGGANATVNAQALLIDAAGAIDMVFLGGAETQLKAFLDGERPERGVAYLSGGRYIDTGMVASSFFQEGGVIDPGIIDRFDQPAQPMYHDDEPESGKYTQFMFSEGCSATCGFCCVHTKEGRFRQMHPDALDRQLDLFAQRGYRYLILENNELCIPEAQDLAMHFFRGVRERNIRWTYNGGLNLDRLSDEVVDGLCNSNCQAVSANFNPRLLECARPSSGKSDIVAKFRRLTEAGVRIFGTVMIGTPHQSRDDIRFEVDSLAALLERRLISCAVIMCLSYFPGTRYTAMHGSLVSDPADYTGQSIYVPQAGTLKGLSTQGVTAELVRGIRLLRRVSSGQESVAGTKETPWSLYC
jgi:hypothetical protein